MGKQARVRRTDLGLERSLVSGYKTERNGGHHIEIPQTLYNHGEKPHTK